MPTKIELIPCVKCGNPRPIRGVVPADFRRAAARLCQKCSPKAVPPQRWSQDVDELTVQFLVAGEQINATPAERRAAVAILTARRLTASAIAERINCTRRTVERHRARNTEAVTT
jgi:DNA-binding NarL/FixJ family response regulator